VWLNLVNIDLNHKKKKRKKRKKESCMSPFRLRHGMIRFFYSSYISITWSNRGHNQSSFSCEKKG
jgi:hypothetical protein